MAIISLSVMNKGLGPASIKSFKIITFIANKKVVHTDWASVLKALNNPQHFYRLTLFINLSTKKNLSLKLAVLKYKHLVITYFLLDQK
jgi:hypothetical protein